MGTRMISVVIARMPGGAINELGKLVLETMPFETPVQLAVGVDHLKDIFPQERFQVICGPAKEQTLFEDVPSIQYSIWKKPCVEDSEPKLIMQTTPMAPDKLCDHLEPALQQHFNAQHYIIIKRSGDASADIARLPE